CLMPLRYGPYHRLESDTQSPETAASQVSSGEVWGKKPRFGFERPKVKAYAGPLPEGVRGIEFYTDVAPDPRCAPCCPLWSGPRCTRTRTSSQRGLSESSSRFSDCVTTISRGVCKRKPTRRVLSIQGPRARRNP